MCVSSHETAVATPINCNPAQSDSSLNVRPSRDTDFRGHGLLLRQRQPDQKCNKKKKKRNKEETKVKEKQTEERN